MLLWTIHRAGASVGVTGRSCWGDTLSSSNNKRATVMTLTYSAPAAYVSVFVCEKEQHFILEEVFKKEKKKILKF